MIINWKLGLLAFVICSVTLIPALDSAYGKTVTTTHTPTFIDAFSVSQEANPEGIAFNTDGTKMFIVGYDGDDVDEYACSNGFDVSSCSYSGNAERKNIKAEDNTPLGIAFNTDGTKMFILGATGDDVNEYDLDKDFVINHEKTFQLNSACAFDIVCKTTNSYDTADQELALLHPWLTEVILLDLQPSDRIVDTTTSMPHVQLEPGDTITITLNVQDDLGPDNIKQVSMYTNYGERPIDMNLFYANNFNDKGETSQSFYHWYPNNDDVAYGYDDTIQWKYVSGYTTNADYSELTKDRISISVGDLIHEASTSSEDRLVVSFTATFEDVMSKSNIKVKMADYDGLYNTVTLPFTIQVGNPDATFEDVMGKHPGYKFIPFLIDSKALESIQQWTDPSSEMTDEQFTQLLGIQETELPSWVKNNLAQWVIEDKINLAVMIIAIEHLINLE